MSRFVLDASVALAWFIDHPVAPYAVEIKEEFERGSSGVVPFLWELEFANGILVAERRKIVNRHEAEEALAKMERLRAAGVEMDSGIALVRDIVALAREFQLTAYDASYVELASREGLPLATLDKKLRTAAVKAGIRIM